MPPLQPHHVLVRMVAAGTPLRTGRQAGDFTPVECLCSGDAVFDPVSARFHDIQDMVCGTLDCAKAREIGMRVLHLPAAPDARPLTCMIDSRDLYRLSPLGPPAPDLGLDEQVFYALAFDGRVTLDAGGILCRMR